MGARRRRLAAWIALIAAGVLIGAGSVGTAGAHVDGWTHNWVDHIRPKADHRYFTKTQINERLDAVYWMRGDGAGNVYGSSDSFVSFNISAPGVYAITFAPQGSDALANCAFTATPFANEPVNVWLASIGGGGTFNVRLQDESGTNESWSISVIVQC
jgi:hypothetical protein